MRSLPSALQMRTMSTMLVMSLAGCSTIYEGKYAYDEGWRLGEIEKIGAPADLGRFGALCRQRRDLSAAYPPVAVVRFDFGTTAGRYMHSSHKLQHVVVQLSLDSPLKKDAHVYVNIRDCEQPLVPVGKLDSKPLQLPGA